MRDARTGQNVTRASSGDDFFAKLNVFEDDWEASGATVANATSNPTGC